MNTPDGAQRRVLSYGGNLMLVQFTFEAGVASWEHSHPHEQVGYVVDGEIDLFMAGHAPVTVVYPFRLKFTWGWKPAKVW